MGPNFIQTQTCWFLFLAAFLLTKLVYEPKNRRDFSSVATREANINTFTAPSHKHLNWVLTIQSNSCAILLFI